MPRPPIIDTDPSPDDAVALASQEELGVLAGTTVAGNVPEAAARVFAGRKVHVAVECVSELTLGITVANWRSVTGKPANVQVLREIDADGYFDLVIERLARL